MFAPSRGPALFWRLAIGNAAVLAAACTITALVFSPSAADVAVRELAIFVGGFALILAFNLLLLRRALAPLRQLTAFARRIDPLEPGNRLDVGGGDSDAAELAAAFNEMLERLETERRDSVRRALAAQEGERLRVAQELHDGVGQSLTGVVLQLGRAARDMPEPSRERRARGAGDRARQPRGGAPDRAPAAARGARRPRAGERAARARRARGRAFRARRSTCTSSPGCRTSAATPSSCSTASPRRR